MVASAPSYAQGVVDPVTQIATLAQAAGVRCHVDACIGGWLLPFLRRDDPELPAFSFLVPGVTSISVDLHKYGYTPKGVSLLLHRDAALRRPQLFATAAWPGYTMVNSTMQSTKSGGPLAAAWAVTRLIGDAGYADLARRVLAGQRALVTAVNETFDHLRVLVPPDVSLVALAAGPELDVFTVCDELLARGWYAQPQHSFGPFPATLHVAISPATEIEEFIDALRGAEKSAAAVGPVVVDPAVAAALGAIDVTALDDAGFAALLSMAGLADDHGGLVLPERMAPVNALLDAAPVGVRELLVATFYDRLSRPAT